MSGSVALEEFIDELIKRADAKGYIPRIFMNMRQRNGTVEAIKELVVSPKIQKGFRQLQELGLLDLSVEAAVLKFPDEFTLEEREAAKWRLGQVSEDFILQDKEQESQNEKFWKTAMLADVKNALDEGINIHSRTENGYTPLHLAAAFNETLEVVVLLLDKGVDMESRDAKGRTPLHLAAANSKSQESVRLLLKQGANINTRADDGRTPLHAAASASNAPELVAWLLDEGANIESCDENGWTPLHRAVLFSKAPEVIELLLDRGANSVAKDIRGRTPFDYAKEREHLKRTSVYLRLNRAQFQQRQY